MIVRVADNKFTYSEMSGLAKVDTLIKKLKHRAWVLDTYLHNTPQDTIDIREGGFFFLAGRGSILHSLQRFGDKKFVGNNVLRINIIRKNYTLSKARTICAITYSGLYDLLPQRKHWRSFGVPPVRGGDWNSTGGPQCIATMDDVRKAFDALDSVQINAATAGMH